LAITDNNKVEIRLTFPFFVKTAFPKLPSLFFVAQLPGGIVEVVVARNEKEHDENKQKCPHNTPPL
jgi:hypothetical protein